MDKEKALKKIADEIADCAECKKGKSGLPVPGEGNPDAKVMFVGEAPGPTESMTGKPFVGRSGKFLAGLLASIGLDRSDVFVTSPVKYYPRKRTLMRTEIEHGSAHLKEQINVIDPKILVLMGSTAIKAALGEKMSIRKVHGTIVERDNRKFFLTFHPAAAVRSARIVRRLMEGDFSRLAKMLQRDI